VFGSGRVLEKETLLRFARSLADLRIEVKQLRCCTTKACLTSEPGSSHKFSCPHDAPLAHDGLLRKPDILICYQHPVFRIWFFAPQGYFRASESLEAIHENLRDLEDCRIIGRKK
jgi:hypothetical protein